MYQFACEFPVKVLLLCSAGIWSGEGDGGVPFSSIHVEAFLMPVSPLVYVQMLRAASTAKSCVGAVGCNLVATLRFFVGRRLDL